MRVNEMFRDHAFSAALLLLVLSTGVNGALAWRVVSLSARLQGSAGPPPLSPGSLVPPLTGKDVNGAPMTIEYSRAPQGTLVYSFAVNCGWCKKNLNNIKALTAAISPAYRVVGLANGPGALKPYLQQNQISFPVMTDASKVTVSAYKLRGTPQTFLISPTGKVLRVWTGAYGGSLKTEIEGYFKVKLPGLPPASGA
jgi:peroxiredoxin